MVDAYGAFLKIGTRGMATTAKRNRTRAIREWVEGVFAELGFFQDLQKKSLLEPCNEEQVRRTCLDMRFEHPHLANAVKDGECMTFTEG
jgi:hypothetical protein